MSKIYLCKPGGVLLGSLTGIDEASASLKQSVSDTWELTFEIGRYTEKDGELTETTYYQSVSEMMELFVDDIDGEGVYFQIDEEPAVNGDGAQEKKTVTAHSIECELSTKMLHNFKINCGVKDSQEYLVGYYDESGTFINMNISPFDELPVDYIVVKNNYADYFQDLKDRLEASDLWYVNPDNGLISQEGRFLDGSYIYPELYDAYYKYKRIYTDVKSDGTWEAYLNILDNKDGDLYNYNLYVYPGDVEADSQIIKDFNDEIEAIMGRAPQRSQYQSDAAYERAVEIWEQEYNDKLNEFREYLDTIANEKKNDFNRERLLTGLQNLANYYCEFGSQLSLIDLALENASISGWTAGDIPSEIAEKKFIFTIDNQDILSFFKTNCTKAMKVLFDFDRYNKKVNIIDIQNEGDENDTGIFLTFRNLINQVDVKSSSNDGVRTKIIPTGQNNLGITYVNFGENNIIDLDWFVDADDEYGEPRYVSTDIRNHYHAWKDYRDKPYAAGSDMTHRDEYIELTKRYNQLLRDIDDLKNKLPFDDCSTDFTKFTFEELNTAYTAYKNARQAIIDMYMADSHAVRFDIDILEAFDVDDSIVSPSIKETFYWEDFSCYHYTIIPNVVNALQIYVYTDDGAHYELRESDEVQYDLTKQEWIAWPGGNPNYNGDAKIVTENESDSYVYDMELYGPVELQAKINAWIDTAAVQYKKGFVLKWNNDEGRWDVVDPPPVDLYIRKDDDAEPSTIIYKYNTADHDGWLNLLNGATGVQDSFTSEKAFIKLMNEYLDYVSLDERYNSILARVDGIKDTIECDTAGNVAAKTAVYAGYNPEFTSRFILHNINENTAATTLTLNINGTGDKVIYINGVISDGSNCTIPEGAFEVRYHKLAGGYDYYDINTKDKLLVNSKGIIPLAQDALDAKEKEVADMEAELAEIQQERQELAKSAALDTFFETNYPTTYAEELKVLHTMLRESDYNNANILTTSLDDIVTAIDKQKELLDDAVIALSEKAQPQLSFEIALDNLFALDDYELMREDVRLLKFIRVSIGLYNDAFKKLRIISITRNPLIPTEELTLEFSNMTYSLQGASDFAHLFDELNGSGSGSSSSSGSSSGGGTYGTNDSEITITNNILSALLRSKSYTNSIGSAFLGGLSSSSVLRNTMAQSGVFGKLEAGYMKVSGDCITDHVRSSNYIQNNQGSSLNLKDGTFDYGGGSLKYTWDNITKKGTLTVIGKLYVKDEEGHVEPVDTGAVDDLINDLKIPAGTTQIDGGHIITNTLHANRIIGGTITGDKIYGGTITGDKIAANTISAGNIAAGAITAEKMSADYVYAGVINASQITSGGTISGQTIQGSSLTTTASDGVYIKIDGRTISFTTDTFYTPLQLSPGRVESLNSSLTLSASGYPIYINGGSGLDGGVNISGSYVSLVSTRFGWGIQSQSIYDITSSSGSSVYILDSASSYTIVRHTSSSKRYKHDIKKLKDKSLNPNKLYDIPVVQFKYNLDYLSEKDQRYNSNVPGFIAEDINKYYPIACNYKDEQPEDWNPRFIIPPMLALIQEQHKDIEELKKQISRLKGE